jgi:hypothetical protein
VSDRPIAEAPNRRGLLTAGLWLIGIGAVLLVRELTGWSWAEAWPLFILLVGSMDLIGTVTDPRRGQRDPWSLTSPIVWIGIGAVLLAATTGSLGDDPIDLVVEWWPWAAIGLGAWLLVGAGVARERVEGGETLEIPLAPGAAVADVVIRYGGGRLDVARAAPGVLVSGTFVGGATARSMGPNSYRLEPASGAEWSWLEGRSSWDARVTGEVPLDLRLETGATRTHLALADSRLRMLTLRTGASDTRVELPSDAGQTSVSIEAGAASITLAIPDGVAARIHGRMSLGSMQVPGDRFPRVDDEYRSADFETATNRVDVAVSGGVGSLRVE